MTTSQHHDADAPVVEVSHDSQPPVSDDPDQLREEIEQTRAELGETVEALAAKADVKAQVKEKVSAGKEQMKAGTEQIREKIGEVTPDQARQAVASMPQHVKKRPLPALLAVGGLLVAWMIRRRRRG